MIREDRSLDNPADAFIDAIAQRVVEKLEDRLGGLGEAKQLLNAQEAAEFLRISYSEFRKLAPRLPRRTATPNGKRYIYWRKELLEWALANENHGELYGDGFG